MFVFKIQIIIQIQIHIGIMRWVYDTRQKQCNKMAFFNFKDLRALSWENPGMNSAYYHLRLSMKPELLHGFACLRFKHNKLWLIV